MAYPTAASAKRPSGAERSREGATVRPTAGSAGGRHVLWTPVARRRQRHRRGRIHGPDRDLAAPATPGLGHAPTGASVTTVIWLRGEHDLSTVDMLSEALSSATTDVTIDLSGVDFMDSTPFVARPPAHAAGRCCPARRSTRPDDPPSSRRCTAERSPTIRASIASNGTPSSRAWMRASTTRSPSRTVSGRRRAENPHACFWRTDDRPELTAVKPATNPATPAVLATVRRDGNIRRAEAATRSLRVWRRKSIDVSLVINGARPAPS
jgi:hypothetical protein